MKPKKKDVEEIEDEVKVPASGKRALMPIEKL